MNTNRTLLEVFHLNTSVNISIYLTEKFLETISEAMHKLGYNSRSEFFRTAARFYLKTCDIEVNENE